MTIVAEPVRVEKLPERWSANGKSEAMRRWRWSGAPEAASRELQVTARELERCGGVPALIGSRPAENRLHRRDPGKLGI